MNQGHDISKEAAGAEKPDNKKRAKAQVGIPTIDQMRSKGFAVQKLLEIRDADKKLGKEHRKHLHNNLGSVYAIATVLRDDQDTWLEFCRHSSWEQLPRGRPKHDGSRDALRYAIRLMVGFRDNANTKRASKYYRALKPLFERGVKPADVVKKIKKAGGIEKLASQNAQQGQSKRPEAKLPVLQTRRVEFSVRHPAPIFHLAHAKKGALILLSVEVLKQTKNLTGLKLIGTQIV